MGDGNTMTSAAAASMIASRASAPKLLPVPVISRSDLRMRFTVRIKVENDGFFAPRTAQESTPVCFPILQSTSVTVRISVDFSL